MAKLLMKWVFLCSNCEQYIVLKPSEKIPSKCPHCKEIFEVPEGNIQSAEKEHTFIPPVEAYLNKLNNKI